MVTTAHLQSGLILNQDRRNRDQSRHLFLSLSLSSRTHTPATIFRTFPPSLNLHRKSVKSVMSQPTGVSGLTVKICRNFSLSPQGNTINSVLFFVIIGHLTGEKG